jgi:8-oxo-dGTP diphosphatase
MVNAPQKYKFAVIATDVVIFTVEKNQLKVLLIKMKKAPYTGYWAAPGGLIKPQESVDAAASRVLKEKAGLSGIHLEQLYTFGKANRDPFGRVVSVGYFALIPSVDIKLHTTDEYSDIQWYPINKLPRLAYDHAEVIQVAKKRLQAKLEYTNIVYSLLPKEFTLSELQQIYETILDRKMDKRNFRKKILSLHILKRLRKKRQGNAHRPAELYSFISRTPIVIKLI